MSVEPGKWGVIYNPKAGTRKVQKRWKEIKEYMDQKGVSYDYVQSEGFGSVERLAGILANNGYTTIVVVGGDGALNDAINGIMLSNATHKESIAIGIIPNGIGNDFARYWDIGMDYKQAVDWIINDEHIRGRIMTVCVGSAYGYGQTPSAVPYNGWLDVSVIYRPELLQTMSGLWMLIQGRILNHKVVKSYRTKKVKVLRAKNAAVDLDGRILPKHFPLEIGILPEKITLIIPN